MQEKFFKKFRGKALHNTSNMVSYRCKDKGDTEMKKILEQHTSNSGKTYELYTKTENGYYGISILENGRRRNFQSYKTRKENALSDWEMFKKTGKMVANINW